jgi:hypothetical protein
LGLPGTKFCPERLFVLATKGSSSFPPIITLFFMSCPSYVSRFVMPQIIDAV